MKRKNDYHLIRLIDEHLRRRPAMEPRDVYKLLYQGICGPEHIITSPHTFRKGLTEEWETLEPTEGDPLWETIRVDGRLMRLNLRPFKAAGGCLDELATACLETSHQDWGTQVELAAAWRDFAATYQKGVWQGLEGEQVIAFTAWLEDNGYPAVHHSENYSKLYQPAYRLVAADISKQYLAGYQRTPSCQKK